MESCPKRPTFEVNYDSFCKLLNTFYSGSLLSNFNDMDVDQT